MSRKQQRIDGLNDDLNLELEAVLRYLHHTAMVIRLEDMLAEETDHAEELERLGR
jgi:bacterioferritin (cytochrome b1)